MPIGDYMIILRLSASMPATPSSPGKKLQYLMPHVNYTDYTHRDTSGCNYDPCTPGKYHWLQARQSLDLIKLKMTQSLSVKTDILQTLTSKMKQTSFFFLKNGFSIISILSVSVI